MGSEPVEQGAQTPDSETRELWVPPVVSTLNAGSAQSGPGDIVPDAGDFS